MPRQIRRIMAAMARGNVQIGMRPDGLDPLVNRFERISNRIVLGVIAAAFINGLAVLLSVYHAPGWERRAWAAFAFGFGCALLLGLYLAWSILQPGKTDLDCAVQMELWKHARNHRRSASGS